MRINRNIVECKSEQSGINCAERICINRNIVECKSKKDRKSDDTQAVLIETLWNVNELLLKII